MNLFMPIFVPFYMGGPETFGIGFYLQLTAAIGQIILGIWKKQIRKKTSGKIKSLIVKRKIIFSEENSNCLS